MGVRHLDDWYFVTVKDVEKNGGNTILARYGHSLMRALRNLYPHHSWVTPNNTTMTTSDDGEKPNLDTRQQQQQDKRIFFGDLRKQSQGFWASLENQRRFLLTEIAPEFGIRPNDFSPEDWESVSPEQIRQRGGAILMRIYGDSLRAALQAIFPEHRWEKNEKVEHHHQQQQSSSTTTISHHGINNNNNSTRPASTTTPSTTITTTITNTTPAGSSSSSSTTNNINNNQQQQREYGYWTNPENQRRFLEAVARDLGIRRFPEDWYRVTTNDIKERGGARLLNLYGDSLIKTLAAVFPQHTWDITSFNNVPHGFWLDRANRRSFFDVLGEKLGVRHLNDWYHITVKDVRDNGAGGVLKYYNNSLIRALTELYPEHEWVADTTTWTQSRHTAQGFWNQPVNQRRFFEQELGKALGIQHLDDWYDVTEEQVRQHGGTHILLKIHKNSLYNALVAAFPEHNWDPSQFLDHDEDATSPAATMRWTPKLQGILGGGANLTHPPPSKSKQQKQAIIPSLAEQREFFRQIGEALGVRRLDDWYRITVRQVAGASLETIDHDDDEEHEHGTSNNNDNSTITRLRRRRRLTGKQILNLYGGSLRAALQTLYPDHPWRVWNFHHMPKNAWDDTETLKQFIEQFLAPRLYIRRMEDWYRVSNPQIRSIGGFGLIKGNGGLLEVLRRVYPEYEWDAARFANPSAKKASQRWLFVMTQQIFPEDTLILEEYRHPGLKFADTEEHMQFDVFLPAQRIALEFHGRQHYDDVYVFGPQAPIKLRDEEKERVCRAAGITLITIPYWWDRTASSLRATIRKARPDVFPPPRSTRHRQQQQETTRFSRRGGGGGSGGSVRRRREQENMVSTLNNEKEEEEERPIPPTPPPSSKMWRYE